MDYQPTEELRMLKETLRRFIDNEVIPIEREAYDGSEMVPEIRAKLEARAQELGIWGVDVPEKLGGLGMGLLARAIIWEETGRTIAFPRRKNGSLVRMSVPYSRAMPTKNRLRTTSSHVLREILNRVLPRQNPTPEATLRE